MTYEEWTESVDGYLRKWIDQLAQVERLALGEGGKISELADSYERHGVKGINLNKLATGIQIVIESDTAKGWPEKSLDPVMKHQKRIKRFIMEKPVKHPKTVENASPSTIKSNEVPPQPLPIAAKHTGPAPTPRPTKPIKPQRPRTPVFRPPMKPEAPTKQEEAAPVPPKGWWWRFLSWFWR